MNSVPLRSRLSSQVTFGFYQSLWPTGAASEAGKTGFDLIFIDTQHGPYDRADLLRIMAEAASSGTVPMVRTLNHDQATIGWMLDAGASAVLIPMVSTREQAESVAAACRYPPHGVRSWSPPIQALYGPETPEQEDQRVVCGVMIETKQAFDGMEEIAAVPGVDFLLLGTSDLALSLGLTIADSSVWLAERLEVLERFAKVCRAHGKAAAVISSSAEASGRYVELGFTMLFIAPPFAEAEADLAAHRAASGVAA